MKGWRPRLFAAMTIVLGLVFAWNVFFVFTPDIFECGQEWPNCASHAYRESLLLVVASLVIWSTTTWLLWKNRDQS